MWRPAYLGIQPGAAGAFAGRRSRRGADGGLVGLPDDDGVCDFAGSGCRYTDTDGDGVCDFAKSGCRYTDADGDGICDRCGRVPGRWLRRESGAETRDTVSGNDGSCSGTDSGMPVGAGNGFRDPAGRQNGFGGGRNR